VQATPAACGVSAVRARFPTRSAQSMRPASAGACPTKPPSAKPFTTKPRPASAGSRGPLGRSRSRGPAHTEGCAGATAASAAKKVGDTAGHPEAATRSDITEGGVPTQPPAKNGSQRPASASGQRKMPSKKRRPASASASTLRETKASDVASAANAAAEAANAGRHWWERLHTCGKVRPRMSLPVGRRFGPPSYPRPPATPQSAGSRAPSWVDAGEQSGTAVGHPPPGPTVHRSPVRATHKNPSGYTTPQRKDSLREDSFIFDDDDGGDPEYFGIDSDVEEEAARKSSGSGVSTTAPQRARRPQSAPSASSTALSGEWWRAPSAHGMSENEWWARDTLRRLHLEQLEQLHACGGPAPLASCQASPAALAAAAALAKSRVSA
jgi:hypothetical protein